jgi:hypothetical protein
MRIAVRPSDDARRYYELHGAVVEGRAVVVPTRDCVFTPDGIRVNMTCSALQDDQLCSLHPDKKPACCTDFTLESARTGGYWVPETCLFSYRMRLDDVERHDG